MIVRAEQAEHTKLRDDCGGLFRVQAQEVRSNSHARSQSVTSERNYFSSSSIHVPLRLCLLRGMRQWKQVVSAVARLCSAHVVLEKRSADDSAALHRERAQSQSTRLECERLQSRLEEQQRELIALQSRCTSVEAFSAAIREESPALLSSHAIAVGQQRERLRRVATANAQLEQLAMNNDIAVLRTIPLLRHSVSGRLAD